MNIPSWYIDADCRDHPHPEWWFDELHDYAEARKVCAGCPVQDECAAHRRKLRIKEGMWGGMPAPKSHQDSGKAARRRKAGAKCVICKTWMPDCGHGHKPMYCSSVCRWKARVARLRQESAA